MRKLISQFVKFPFYANLIIASLLLAGGISILTMKKSFFPELTSRYIYVTVFYPGASPVEMEEGVTTRIEEAIRGIVGIKETTSTSSENMTSVRIETTGEYDIDETLMEVKNAVDGISSFPTAAERPIVYKQRTTSMALFMSLSGDVDLMTLKEYGQRVEEDFLNSGIISQVSLSGYPSPEISVEVDEANLVRYGITISEIMQAISSNNRDVSGGQIRSENEEILIRLRSRSADPDKIGNIILRGTTDGGYIRIRDVANIKKQFADVPQRSFKKGKPVVSLRVSKLNSEDLEEITKYCEDYAKDFNAKNNGVTMSVEFSFLDLLKSRLDLLLYNGMTGLIMVIISLALFLNFRLSLWVAWGIPSSFLAMFIVANQIGITMNMISLFGMILVIGILVDDGIVIGENIYQHFEKGKSPMKAAVDGTMEVMPAVITSVTTTIVAFMPLLFLKNQMERMREMALVVIISLVFSLLEAFFVLPSHLSNSRVLNPRAIQNEGRGLKGYLENGIKWLRERVYGQALKWILHYRYLMLGLPFALVMITMGLIGSGKIRTTIFPAMEFDSFNINIAFTPGSGENQTIAYLKKFENIVWEVNDEMLAAYPHAFDNIKPSLWSKLTGNNIDTSHTFIDHTFVNIGSSFDGLESGSHAGLVSVFPRNLEGTGISSYEIINRVREKIGDVPEAEKMTVAGRSMFGNPVSLSLLGRNTQELAQARDFMFKKLGDMPQLKDIVDNNAMGKQEIQLKLKPKAYFLGLNEAMIANQVREGFYGGQAQRLQEGRDELRVWVRFPRKDRETIGQLENMKIITAQGEYPLNELADYKLERGPVAIKRFNGMREIRVEADVVDRNASVTDILNQVETEVIPELQSKFPGIRLVAQGQQKEGRESMQVILMYYSIAFFVIVMILMIHFKSFEQPVLILLMIPLSLLGAIWGHGIVGKPVSMLSMWGMVALSGVIINDAVVFLSRYNDLLLQKMTVKEAIIEAGKSRLRPILLTTITTTVGLYPLILEKSFQAQFLIPMAISLAYGVAIGTFFILVFFPALILILNDFRVVRHHLWNGVKPEREEVEIAIIHSLRRIEGDDDEPEVNKVVSDLDLE